MKFTEAKLKKHKMKGLIYKEELQQSRVWLTSQRNCEVNHTSSNFKMSSFFTNKLDKITIFAAQ